MDPAPRLLTIPISHYCERARWALEYCDVPHVEEQHLQMLHRRPVRRAGGGTTTPALVTASGTLADSAEIVAYADARAPADRRLYPDDPTARDEVRGWERSVEGRFGIEARRLAYHGALPMGRRMQRFNGGRAPVWERALFQLGFPLAAGLLRRYMRVDENTAARARERLAPTLDRVAERIADRTYLAGDRFTAADLTFAALAAPLVVPAGYGVRLPAPADLPDAYRALVEDYRAHPAGAFVLRLYRDHRHPPRAEARAAG